MRKILIVIYAFLCIFLCLNVKVYAKSTDITSINNLIENEKSFDGKTVTIKAEAIGEPMKREDYTWVNVNDGTNAIGIWMKNSDAAKIKNYGNYKNIGDTLKIKGIFKKNCSEHDGDTDIHALQIEVLNEGKLKGVSVGSGTKKAAVIMPASTILMVLIYYLYCHSKRL